MSSSPASKKGLWSSNKLYYFLLGLAVLFLLLSLGLTWLSRPKGLQTPAEAPSVPSNLANLDIVTLEGRRFPLPPLKGGVILVISTTCPHCHSLLERLASAEKSQGPFTNLTILSLQGAKEGEVSIRPLGLKAPVVGPGLPPSEFAKRLGLTNTPTLYLVSPQGQLKFFEVGVTSETLPNWIELMR